MLADDGTGAFGDDDAVATEYIEEDGRQFELLSFYALPDDAWSIELTAMHPGGGLLAHVLVPDEDLQRPCQILTFHPEQIPSAVMGRLLLEAAEVGRHAGVSFQRDQGGSSEA